MNRKPQTLNPKPQTATLQALAEALSKQGNVNRINEIEG